MATSTITLYKSGISRDRNARIEDISVFLSQCENMQKTGVQRIRNGMNITIKLNIPQEEADILLYDYAEIVNSDSDRSYYYFITNSVPTAQETVTFSLALDTINTFFGDLVFTDKTYIEREHKDRFETFVKSVSTRASAHRRIIDLKSEGNVPLKYLDTKTKIDYTNVPNIYLVYRSNVDVTSESVGAVSIEAYPDVPINMGSNEDTFTTPTSVSSQHTFALIYSNFIWDSATAKGQNQDGDGITFYRADGSYVKHYITPGKTFRMVEIIYHQGDSSFILMWSKSSGWRQSTVNLGFVPDKIKINAKLYYYNADRTIESLIPDDYTIVDISADYNQVKTIDQVDRTDAKLIKIIALPYPPFPCAIDDTGKVDLPSGWFVDSSGVLTLLNLTADFETAIHAFDFTDELSYSRSQWGDTTKTRDDGLESKIYHSDYYTRSLVYDSFSRPIAMERLKRSEAEGTPTTADLYKVTVYFKPTNTINSKFAFKFRFYDGLYTGYYWLDYTMVETFENYLLCDRNNELTIFSNNYINYLRTGYNYDVKNRAIQSFSTLLGGATSLASNVGMGAISGNYAGAIIGGVTSVASTITGMISQQNAFEQKQQQMREQATSVSGSNDLDLLQYYSDNKAFDCVYKMSKEQQTNFLNLFYYCGYAVREMRKPIVDSRYWFNYLQCTPQFDTTATKINNDYLTDITNRLKEGVTIFHDHSSKWDFSQTLENWESWMC